MPRGLAYRGGHGQADARTDDQERRQHVRGVRAVQAEEGQPDHPARGQQHADRPDSLRADFGTSQLVDSCATTISAPTMGRKPNRS
jgi:hypothetical protein